MIRQIYESLARLGTLALLLSPAAAFAEPSVLIIGDSHGDDASFSGPLMSAIARGFSEKNHFFASCGSKPAHWLNGWRTNCGFREAHTGQGAIHLKSATTPVASALIARFSPNVIVIELGTNLLPDIRDEKYVRQNIESLLGAIAGTACYWIGPPDMRAFSRKSVSRLYELLEDAIRGSLSNCQIIDSRSCVEYPAARGDGKHYTAFPELASAWATCAAAEILRKK